MASAKDMPLTHCVSIFLSSMRWLAAHLAFAAIWLGFLAPSIIAAQESAVHACCLRAGAHHCQGSSSEAGFHSATNACPYSSARLVAGFTGLKAVTFRISSPGIGGLVIRYNSYSDSRASVRDLSARAPPSSLL
jgi:hypothetical protein